MTMTTLLLLLRPCNFTHVWHIASEQFNSVNDNSPVWASYRVSPFPLLSVLCPAHLAHIYLHISMDSLPPDANSCFLVCFVEFTRQFWGPYGTLHYVHVSIRDSSAVLVRYERFCTDVCGSMHVHTQH